MLRQGTNPKQRQAMSTYISNNPCLCFFSNIYTHITNQCGGPCEFSKMQMFAYKNSPNLGFHAPVVRGQKIYHWVSALKKMLLVDVGHQKNNTKPWQDCDSFGSFIWPFWEQCSWNRMTSCLSHPQLPQALEIRQLLPHSSESSLRLFQQTFGTHPERNLCQQAK